MSSGSEVETSLVVTNLLAATEGICLTATVGLNTQSMFDQVKGSAGDSFCWNISVPPGIKNDWNSTSVLSSVLNNVRSVTDAARAAQVPLTLANTAESTYQQASTQAATLKNDDDSKLVQLYLPKTQSNLVSTMASADTFMTSSHQVSKDIIVDLLCGIQLAASIEAMAFCKALGQDRRQTYETISDSQSAGWSAAFSTYIPDMLQKDSWTLADCSGAAEVGMRLSNAVDKCRLIQYPCPMASAALQQYNFATLATKTVDTSGR